MAGLLLVDRLGTDLQRTGQPLLIISSALVGSLAIVFVLRLARLTLVRDGTGRPRTFLTILWLAVAASTAAFTGRIHDETVGLPVDTLSIHIFERTGWGFAVLLLLTICTTAATGLRADIAAQHSRAAALRRIKTEVDSLLSTAVASELNAVTADVRAAVARLERADAHEAISLLQEIGFEVIRARSHALAEPLAPYQPAEPARGAARVRFLELAVDATDDRPIRPALPVAMVAVWGAAVSLADASPIGALIIGSVLGVVALGAWGSIGLVVDRLLHGHGPLLRIVIVLMAIPAAAVGWVIAAEAVEQVTGLALPTAETAIQRAAQALTLTLFPIAQMSGRAFRRRDERSLEAMTAYNDTLTAEVARANTELWAQRRALSVELHGFLQSTVNAAALRVSNAARQGHPHDAAVLQARSDIESALVSLEGRIARHGRGGSKELDRAIARIRGMWEGLVDIRIDLPESLGAALEDDATIETALIEALTESCSNAVRHGAARRIHARITAQEQVVLLQVIDDGLAAGRGSPGQGSALLDEITLEWQRTRDDSGTCLTATFPRR
jgi:signal transduction histidine kinase